MSILTKKNWFAAGLVVLGCATMAAAAVYEDRCGLRSTNPSTCTAHACAAWCRLCCCTFDSNCVNAICWNGCAGLPIDCPACD